MQSYDLNIYKGATYSLGLTVKDTNGVPLNLSGYGISGYLKFGYSNTGRLADLNATRSAPFSGGTVNLSIPASVTESLPCGVGFYDIEIRSSGDGSVTKILRGRAEIFPETTY